MAPRQGVPLWLALAAALALCVARAPARAAAQSCNGCVDGSQCCGDYPTCCTLVNSTSTVCCASNENCCQGFCCDSDETCCADPVYGGVCCIQQETYCCLSSAQHPNRCCPRWTVCCDNDAQEGCCAPQSLGLPPYHHSEAQVSAGDSAGDSTGDSVSASVIYALFMEVDTVDAVHINASSGQVIAQIPVTGFKNFGEMTRVFAFDGSRTVFYFLEADFLHPPGPLGRAVTLWTIDPITGRTTNATVSGLYNLPTGWHYDCANDRLLVATQVVQGQGPDEQVVGFTFAAVDPSSAAATVLSTSSTSGGEDGVNEWAGWFHAVALNGSVAYRNGWRNVTLQQDYGLSVTAFAGADGSGSGAATTWWHDGVPLPANHQFYASLQVTAGDWFLSLSPRNSDDGFDLVRWSAVANSASVIAQFGNANPPPLFGPIADVVSCDQSAYVAAIVHDNAVDPDFDRWALAVVDLTDADALRYLLISPLMDAKMSSISGVGVPQPDAHALCRRRSTARA